MSSSSSSKIAIVTGANRGLGLGFTKAFVNLGWIVYATARAPEQASELAQFASGHQASVHIIQCDVASESSVKSAISEIGKSTAHVNLLINNAGVMCSATHIEDQRVDDLIRAFEVNVGGVLMFTQQALPLLRATDASEVAAMAVVSSSMGSVTNLSSSFRPAYRVSKAAVNALIKCMAVEYNESGTGERKVTIVSLSPGWIATDMGKQGGRQPPTTTDQGVEKIVSNVLSPLLASNDSFGTYNGRFYHCDGKEMAF
jgi:NAD(P)-dependent dehydrogenase (short-subunit alcohol dehydrogenase family)